MKKKAVLWSGALGVWVACAATAFADGAAVPPFSGITEPRHAAVLSSRVPGMIDRILVEEGARVEKGQVLIELDRRIEELEVSRRQLVSESKAEVDSAADRMQTVKLDLEGTKRVFDTTKSVSREEMRKKELEFKLASAEWERLRALEEREAIELSIAQEQKEQRFIRSPMRGTVTKLLAEEGETCEARQPLIQVVDTSEFDFVGNVDHRRAAGLSVGRTAVLTVPSGVSTQKVRGRIVYVAPVVDAASGLREVRARFANEGDLLRPGVSGELSVEPE